VLSYGVRLHSYSEVEDSILFPNVTVGRYASIKGAIIDSGVHIPDGAIIGYDLDIDREYYTVTDAGRVVVTSTTVFSAPNGDTLTSTIEPAGTGIRT
jgi:glucose-1-phosphate adenylyltransferase